MIKLKRLFSVLLIVMGLILFSVSCKQGEEAPKIITIKIYGTVKDTFSGEVLSGVQVLLKTSEGEEYEVRTDEGGEYEFELQTEEGKGVLIKLYFNFDRARPSYIPSVITKNGEESDSPTTFIQITESTRIDNDLVKKYDIFLKNFINDVMKEWNNITEEDVIVDIINAYRGRRNGGVNQVWVSKPEKWIVYDPNNVLKQYSDPKNNEVFTRIMEGFRAIEEYTNGFIIAPSKDKVEINNDPNYSLPDGAISFEITDGDAYEGDFVNSNNEIYKSGAGAYPLWDSKEKSDTLAELVSSVQGGDSEAGRWIPVVFMSGSINYMDRLWGKFNYKKREPGSSIILTIFENNSYGFTYETRDYEEIQRLANN